jgi:hypothetical protein
VVTIYVTTAMQVRRGIIAAKARLKDPDAQRALEGDLVDSVELLEHSANLALAALFLVGRHPALGVVVRVLRIGRVDLRSATVLEQDRGWYHNVLKVGSEG